MIAVSRAVKFVALAVGVTAASVVAESAASETARDSAGIANASKDSTQTPFDLLAFAPGETDSLPRLGISGPLNKLDPTLAEWIRSSPQNCTGHPNDAYFFTNEAIEARLDCHSSRGMKGLRICVYANPNSENPLQDLIDEIKKSFGVKPSLVVAEQGILGFENFPRDKNSIFRLALNPDITKIELPQGDCPY